MNESSKKKCVPCSSSTPPLKGEELQREFALLEDWTLEGEKEIKKTYKFKDFKTALGFVNDVGKIAEEEGHHPDIELSWGKVVIHLSTHKIHGLSKNDFILAEKCDVAFTSRVQ